MAETTVSVFGFVFNLHGKAAIIVSVIFYVIFALIFFSICWCACGCSCPRRQRHRNRRTTYTTTTAARATTTTSTSLSTTASDGGTAASTASPRLDPRVLASIPSFVYRSTTHDDKLECAVCLAKFKEGEKGRLLMRCGHSFHAECIDEWFKSHSTCPVCRSVVDAETTELPV